MIKKTNEYSMFIFRDDNREKIDQKHVLRLVESIKSRNMLDLRPICVNGKFEVIDGQHRLLAAKHLGVEIYYQVEESLNSQDIILMNVAKTWSSADYLNYYCQNGHQEYIALKEFIKVNQVSLKVALSICMGTSKDVFREFKEGKLSFKEELLSEYIPACWQTIDYIKRMNGFSAYTDSTRFWRALVKLVMHHNFDMSKWIKNLGRMIERVGPRAKTEDYLTLFMDIHNWRNSARVSLLEDDEE